MDLNKQFAELFDNILTSNKYRKKILKLIQKYYDINLINLDFTLCLIKSLILILSEEPNKCKFLFKILKLLDNSSIITKNNIKELINMIDFTLEKKLLDDDVENIILFTLKLLKILYTYCKDQTFSILYQITNSILKIKKIKMKIKIFIYIKLVNESIIIIKEYKTKSYLKIVELCGNIYKLINEYLLI
jgi:hypothetical protein